MKHFTLFMLIFIFLISTTKAQVPGAPYKIDETNPMLLTMLKTVEHHFPAKLNGKKLYYRIGKILTAHEQIVAGKITEVVFELHERPCRQLEGCVEQTKTCFSTIFDDLKKVRHLNKFWCVSKENQKYFT